MRGFLDRARIPVWTLGFMALLAAPASAQPADFLFRRPSVTLGIRGGWAMARAQSEIFDFTSEQLIRPLRNGATPRAIGPGDFASPVFQFEIGVAALPRLDVTVGVGVSQSRVDSESRGFVGTDDLPIEQTTRVLRVPVTAGAKVYLKDRGRAVSRFAWVPYSWTPWVGAGVGGMYSRFEQSGEFVDFETLEIFEKDYRSAGGSPTAHLSGGVDFSLGSHLLATGEARYLWGKADMSRDFVGFDRIDLSGFQITAGISARF